MKPQIVFIHGGDSFDTDTEFYQYLHDKEFDPYAQERKRWRDWIKVETQDTHECFLLQMPNALDADYTAWSIWFEKVIPFLHNGVTLVGHSLGGSFLLRYLTQNKLPVTVTALHLVAPCVDTLDCPGMGNFATDLSVWSGFASVPNVVHLWHSTDDALVPYHHTERFAAVYPSAIVHTFSNRFHFIEETFPELLETLGLL